jgi:hypothetical protein
MNSFSLSASVCARTTRAVPAQLMMESAMKRFKSVPPRMYMTTIARSSDGNASTTSARRMMTPSTLPP